MTSETRDESNPPEAPSVEGPPQADGKLYPFLIVMLAVFPATLGISFTRQSPAKPSGSLAAADSTPALPNDIQARPRNPSPAAPDRKPGDELLRNERYEAALHHYRSLGSPDSLRVSPEIALRMGICQEALGLWDESLATYRSTANSHRRALATAAILGQSRIWIKLNEFARAESLLRSLLLQSRDLPAEAAAEIRMLYPIVLAERELAEIDVPSKFDLAPVSILLDWSLADSLKWIESPTNNSTADAMATSGIVTGETSENSFDQLNGTFEISVDQQPLAVVIQELIQANRLTLEWSTEAQQRAEARLVSVKTGAIPVSLVLLALCQELNACYEYQPQTKVVQVHLSGEGSSASPRNWKNSADALRDMKALLPNQPLSASATFALAQLAAADGDLTTAVRIYSSLTNHSAAPLAIRAALNSAIASYRQGDLVRACQSLQIVVHGGPGNEFHTRALILYGRVLMDRGEFREAAFQLKRAAGSRHRPDEQARAAVLEGMAEILDGRPQVAAESLFGHRLLFQDHSVRSGAALMTSVARWRTLSDAARNREAAFLYRSIIAVQEDSEWLGAPGQFLLGLAMRDADMEDSMADLFNSSLEQGVPKTVQQLMRLALADYWYAHDRRKEAKAVWLELHEAGGANAVAATLCLASASLDERQAATCLDYCRTLQESETVSRTELLRLAGRAYEMSGRPVLAARCYAGEWPVP